MDARFGYYDNPAAAKVTKYLISAGKVVSDSTLPALTQQLVEIRASQINGCAVCTDMHTKDAALAGETFCAAFIQLVATWREATVLPPTPERAALELAENRAPASPMPPHGVTDEAWASKYYDDDQLAALVSLIALINTWNRMNVITQQPAGGYQPGQFG